MERPPAVPELLRRLDRREAHRVLATERICAAIHHERVAEQGVAARPIRPTICEEADVVRRDRQHYRRSADLIVHDPLAAQTIPVVRLALAANRESDDPRLVMPGYGVRTGQRLATLACLVIIVLPVSIARRRIGLHDETRWMQRQPLRERDLLALDLAQHLSLPRTDDGLTIRLTPPAPRRAVLEHGVEVVHPDQPERLRPSVHRRIEHAPGTTHRAVAHEDRTTGNRITHLMVVAEKADRIRARLISDGDADDQR